MARIEKNSLLDGLRGTLGDHVFRTWDGKTIVTAKPRKPTRQTAAQKANRARFREASLRAKQMLMDDTLRNHYDIQAILQKLPNAYTAALREQLMKDKTSNNFYLINK